MPKSDTAILYIIGIAFFLAYTFSQNWLGIPAPVWGCVGFLVTCFGFMLMSQRASVQTQGDESNFTQKHREYLEWTRKHDKPKQKVAVVITSAKPMRPDDEDETDDEKEEEN